MREYIDDTEDYINIQVTPVGQLMLFYFLSLLVFPKDGIIINLINITAMMN